MAILATLALTIPVIWITARAVLHGRALARRGSAFDTIASGSTGG